MAKIQDCGSWQKVATLDEFRAYLMILSNKAEEITAHTHSEGDQITWNNSTLPRFIAGWASYLTGAGEIGRPAGDALDWQRLAYFLFAARNHEPLVSDATDELIAGPEDVRDRDGLISYLRWLHQDFAHDQEEAAEREGAGLWSHEGRWAHADLASWFEAWAAWLDGRRARTLVDPVTWNSCATQLAAARVYE